MRLDAPPQTWPSAAFYGLPKKASWSEPSTLGPQFYLTGCHSSLLMVPLAQRQLIPLFLFLSSSNRLFSLSFQKKKAPHGPPLLSSLLPLHWPRRPRRPRHHLILRLLRRLGWSRVRRVLEFVSLFRFIFLSDTYIPLRWIARAQTDSYTDTRHKGFRKWADVLKWWRDLCAQHHQGGCPAFEPIIFTLNPPNSTHLSSTPCTAVAPAALPVYVNAPAGTHYPGATPAAIAAAAAPYRAPAPSAAAVAAAPRPSGADAIAPAGSPFMVSPSDVKKEEE
jgi:hypothetical protein